MKKKFKKLSLLLSGFLFSFLVIGQFSTPTSAKEIDNGLKKLEYTIYEIREMSLGEYYEKIFPEIFEEFTEEEKEILFKTPYPKETENSNSKGLINGWSSMEKKNSTQVNYTVRTDIYATHKAKKIQHSIVMFDQNGTTWMSEGTSGTDTKSFATRGYKDIKTGNRYKIETVHTITMPSNYSPTVSSSKSDSAWISM